MGSKFMMYLTLGISIFNFYAGSMNLFAFMAHPGFSSLLWAVIGIGLGVWMMKSYLRMRTQLRGY